MESLVIEDTLRLKMELPSRGVVAITGIEIPEMDDAEEVRPLFGGSLENKLLLLSGNKACTKVAMSAGDKTKNG